MQFTTPGQGPNVLRIARIKTLESQGKPHLLPTGADSNPFGAVTYARNEAQGVRITQIVRLTRYCGIGTACRALEA